MKLKNKAQIESWLEQGDLAEVVDALKKQLKSSKSGTGLYSDVLVLSAQLKKINADKIERVMSYEQENIALNNFRRSLMEFIGTMEQYDGTEEEAAPVSTPKKEEKKEGRKGGFAWWLLLAGAAVLGIWFIFFQKKAPVPISICTLGKVSLTGHCCNDDLPRISLFESNSVLYVTAPLTDDYGPDPIIQAVVFWETGEAFPTQPIRFSYDITTNDLCHLALVQPMHGTAWHLGKFTFQLQLNGEVAGEKEFEIIR